MSRLPTRNLVWSDIQTLKDQKVREDKYIEYKEKLPDRQSQDFLDDVSAFANAGGGDIIYGIRENKDSDRRLDGTPGAIVGLRKGTNLEQVTQALLSGLEHTVDPKLPGVRIVAVTGKGKTVLVVRVPRSWIGPHMVKGSRSFYVRMDARNQLLDTAGLRARFLATEAVENEVNRFRDQRLARVLSGEAPIPLYDSPRIVLHVAPFAMLDRDSTIGHQALDDVKSFVTPMCNEGAPIKRFNLDGVIIYSPLGDPGLASSYVQLFRTGAMEYVESYTLGAHESKSIPSGNVEQELIAALNNSFLVLFNLGVDGPLAIMPTLIGIRDYTLDMPTEFEQRTGGVVRMSEDVLRLPETVLETLSGHEHADVLLRDAFDVMWQAGGKRMCPDYPDGRWKLVPRNRW